jgi:hypothetical protein
MRAVIFAAALLVGTAAYAQDTSTTGGAQATNAAAGGEQVAPSNAAPKRDARGIPVISAPATSPSGWNQPPGTPGAAPATQPAGTEGNAGPLPPCTRKVTDNCTQTYERSHGPAGTGMAAGGSDTGGAAAGTSDDSSAAADTGTGTKKTTHHRRRHHRK